MASERKIIDDLIYHHIQKTNSKKLMDNMYRLMKKNGEVKNFHQFQKWIIDECAKSVPFINQYLIKKYSK